MSSKAIRYLKQAEAINIDKELFDEYAFSVEQLMELAGLSCAQTIYHNYPASSYKNVLVISGPGNNGGDGLVCARHLKHFGYGVAILTPKMPNSDLMKRLLKQTSDLGIPNLIGEMAKSFEQDFALIVDAIFGFSFKPPAREPFTGILGKLAKSRIPIFSVDVPSGWDVENGPPSDGTVPVLKPHSLISLTAPKLCAKFFKGNHFLGGRFVPNKLKEKYELNLPNYVGDSSYVPISEQNK